MSEQWRQIGEDVERLPGETWSVVECVDEDGYHVVRVEMSPDGVTRPGFGGIGGCYGRSRLAAITVTAAQSMADDDIPPGINEVLAAALDEEVERLVAQARQIASIHEAWSTYRAALRRHAEAALIRMEDPTRETMAAELDADRGAKTARAALAAAIAGDDAERDAAAPGSPDARPPRLPDLMLEVIGDVARASAEAGDGPTPPWRIHAEAEDSDAVRLQVVVDGVQLADVTVHVPLGAPVWDEAQEIAAGLLWGGIRAWWRDAGLAAAIEGGDDT